MIFDPNPSIQEKKKQEEFLKDQIYKAFNLFHQKEGKVGFVDKKEIPYIMRYLGQFPSEAQVRDAILPEIEEDEPNEAIKYTKFEPYMLNVLQTKEYEPDDPETLLAAFKLLDPEGLGYIEVDLLRTFLTQEGIKFRDKEAEQFFVFATKDSKVKEVVYYEDYISRLQNYYEKHMESIMKGYTNFQVSNSGNK